MVSQSLYYQKLSNYISQDKVSIHLILSPPRTGSTLMEAVLSQNNNIDLAVHEPFVQLGYYGDNAEDGYKTLVEKVESCGNNGRVNVLVKEMSHWLDTEEEYKRFLSLVRNPVLFLIRNPLLSMESRIKKVLQVWEVRDKPELIEWLAKEMDIRTDEYSLSVQKRLLNMYAQRFNFKDWNDLRDSKFQEQNYGVFGDLLAIKGLFPIENSGWAGLDREITYLDKSKRDFIIIDSTEFRLSPSKITQRVFDAWNMEKSESVENRSYETKKLDIRMQKAHYRLWYDSLTRSSDIRLPTEKTPRIRDFPDQIRTHLEEVAIPIYLRSFMNKRRVEGSNFTTENFDLEAIDPYTFSLIEGWGNRTHKNNSFIRDSETWKIWNKSLLKLFPGQEGDFAGRRR